MIRQVAAALLLAGLLPRPAAAENLVILLSANEVRINSNFTGAGITVFGAVEDDARVDLADDYEIAVVVQGPPETIVTRRKDSVLGLWINRAGATFADIPEFYAIHTTGPLEALGDGELLGVLRVGLANLPLVPSSGATAAFDGFDAALLRLKVDEGHYAEEIGVVDIRGSSIFSTTFELPADIPVGDYAVSVFLFRGGELVTMTEETLAISKSGAEQFLFDASRNAPWFYAIAMIGLAIGIGWLGGVLFRRD